MKFVLKLIDFVFKMMVLMQMSRVELRPRDQRPEPQSAAQPVSFTHKMKILQSKIKILPLKMKILALKNDDFIAILLDQVNG